MIAPGFESNWRWFIRVRRKAKAHRTTAAALALSVATQAAGSAATQPAANKAREWRRPRRPAPSLRCSTSRRRRFHRSVQIAHRRAERAKAAGRRRASERHAGRRSLPRSQSASRPATLDAIAACESGGDPAAVSPDGTYRGKYQFDYGTWASVGGSGDPAAAPEAEQDYRAALLYSRGGSSPWPICGS